MKIETYEASTGFYPTSRLEALDALDELMKVMEGNGSNVEIAWNTLRIETEEFEETTWDGTDPGVTLRLSAKAVVR
jgi:hypothetical protein